MKRITLAFFLLAAFATANNDKPPACPPGQQGPQGPRGLPGINGRDGINGKDGINGRDGINGKDGKNGRDGINGLNGKDGAPGRTGANGLSIQGDTGKDGTHGLPGIPGQGFVQQPITTPESDLHSWQDVNQDGSMSVRTVANGTNNAVLLYFKGSATPAIHGKAMVLPNPPYDFQIQVQPEFPGFKSGMGVSVGIVFGLRNSGSENVFGLIHGFNGTWTDQGGGFTHTAGVPAMLYSVTYATSDHIWLRVADNGTGPAFYTSGSGIDGAWHLKATYPALAGNQVFIGGYDGSANIGYGFFIESFVGTR